MKTNRRAFLKSGIYAGIGSSFAGIHTLDATTSTGRSSPDYSELDAALAKPV